VRQAPALGGLQPGAGYHMANYGDRWRIAKPDGPLLYDPSDGTLAQARNDPMIVRFREDWLRVFFVDDIRSRNIPPEL
jgi:hypothetical protein